MIELVISFSCWPERRGLFPLNALLSSAVFPRGPPFVAQAWVDLLMPVAVNWLYR